MPYGEQGTLPHLGLDQKKKNKAKAIMNSAAPPKQAWVAFMALLMISLPFLAPNAPQPPFFLATMSSPPTTGGTYHPFDLLL